MDSFPDVGFMDARPAPDLIAAAAQLHISLSVSEGDAHPDAEILQFCKTLDDVSRRILALYEQGKDAVRHSQRHEKKLAKACRDADAIFEKMRGMRARTVDGLVALARSTALRFPEIIDEDPFSCDQGDALAGVIIRDLAALHPAAAPVPNEVMSCFYLASKLPSLEACYLEIDRRIAEMDENAPAAHRLLRDSDALVSQIAATQRFILVTPARTLADATAQLLHAFAALDCVNEDEIKTARRAVLSALRVTAAAAGVDLVDLGFGKFYAPGERDG